ncbi:Serine/threonine-protein kinase [Thalictrum thalictroides]|uniref:non-specific serine/threonine protein kinase n=1 Tax=Thalictrum thalictroides TaxID=46969 RepID=A0A7J6XFM9_THATH|nr:Serine/threonine-protein kinase [Thalictrum thalictroides]
MKEEEFPLLDLETLKAISVLGRGAKGIAFLVRNEEETLALKVISKALIEKKKNKNMKNNCDEKEETFDHYKRIWIERDVLNLFNHPLLPKLRGFLDTNEIIGFAMDYCSGGDLNTLRKKQTEKMFSDDVISGSISSETMVKRKKRSMSTLWLCNSTISQVDSVETSMHSGTLSVESVEKSNSFVGTEEYVAPEIITGKGHDFGVDWWSLGVVLYEMLYGKTPFRGINRKETFYRILTKSPELVGEQTDLRDLIKKLLEKDPEKRISVEEIKGHDYFKGINWDSIVEISRPPYIPPMKWDYEIDLEEIEGIDVQLMVKGIFERENVNKNKDYENIPKNNSIDNKSVWVEGLKNPKDADFLIF